MDPLTAFSLAGTVISVVDFGFKLTGVVRDLTAHGAKEELLEIESENAGLKRLTATLQSAITSTAYPQSRTSTEDDLLEVCRSAKLISDELSVLLTSLKSKVSSHKTTPDVLWKAVKSEWKDAEIKKYHDRLDRLEKRTQTLLQVNYGSEILHRLRGIERQSQDSGINRQFDKLHELLRAHDRNAAAQNTADLVRLMIRAADQGRQISAELMIFEQIRFPDIDARTKMLEERPAHVNTLSWVDQQATTTGDGRTPVSFTSWLSSGRHLFWISGKPGAGKSTLMQFLFGRSETKQHLMHWSKDRKLLVAAHFFWELGGIELLRKQEGLLRTLIFQILRQYPDMVEIVYQEQYSVYQEGTGKQTQLAPSDQRLEVDVTIHGLLSTIRKICNYVGAHDLRLCLFVDGLDEYDGKPADIIKLMRTFQDSPNVKVCCASRPDNPFIEAYGSTDDKLFMEEFNKQDIEIYVKDGLSEYHLFKELEAEEGVKLGIAKEIVESAQGVFLWVILVLEQLRLGLENRDTMQDLQKRLRSMPKDLMPFFEHMLQRVDGFYRQRSAVFLMVALTSERPLPSLAYWYISEADGSYIQMPSIAPSTLVQTRRYRKDIKNRLNACCKGLLEIQHDPLDTKLESLPSSTIFSQKVSFLHRTVREFLFTQAAHTVLDPHIPPGCNIDILICSAILAHVRSSPTDLEYLQPDGPISSLVDSLSQHLEASKSNSTDRARLTLKPQILETFIALQTSIMDIDVPVPRYLKYFLDYEHDRLTTPPQHSNQQTPTASLSVPSSNNHRRSSSASRLLAKLLPTRSRDKS